MYWYRNCDYWWLLLALYKYIYFMVITKVLIMPIIFGTDTTIQTTAHPRHPELSYLLNKC